MSNTIFIAYSEQWQQVLKTVSEYLPVLENGKAASWVKNPKFDASDRKYHVYADDEGKPVKGNVEKSRDSLESLIEQFNDVSYVAVSQARMVENQFGAPVNQDYWDEWGYDPTNDHE